MNLLRRVVLGAAIGVAAGCSAAVSGGGEPGGEAPGGNEGGGGARGPGSAGARAGGAGGGAGAGPGAGGAAGASASGSDAQAGAGMGGPDGGRAGTDGGPAPAADARPGDGAAPAAPDELAYLKKVPPILWLTVGGKAIVKGTKTPGMITVVEEHDGSRELASLDGLPVALASRMGIELRGQSSSYFFAQKPYGIELQDETGLDRELPLLGLPRESDWVLSTCYSDKTCMHNALTYAIGREAAAAAGRWAPRTRWVEVYLDNRYWGLYLLVEKPKASRGRVNLPRPAATMADGDLTGGYIFSADGDMASFAYNPRDDRREWFDALVNRRWKHRFPNQYDITPAQKTYISTTFTALENTLNARGDWRRLIDAPSWMDYYLVSEFNNNVDAFYRSWYFHKQPAAAGGKFFMGPLWDYDLAFGNTNYGRRYCTTTTILGPPAPFAVPLNDPTFQNELRCRWHELRRPGAPLDIARIESKIDAFAAHIKAAKTRDARRWGNIGKFVWPNNYIGATWEDEIAYLRFWTRKRLAWVDAKLRGQCPSIPAPPAVSAVPQPPNKPNDNRFAEAMARPPQIDPTKDPPTFVPVDNPAGIDPKWACPAP